MSFSRQSELPKRMSIANEKNALPFSSSVAVDSSTRARRSLGGGRRREKLWLSRSTSGFTSPSSTRRSAHSEVDGSSAEANEGTSERAKTHEQSEGREFTTGPFYEFYGRTNRRGGSPRN